MIETVGEDVCDDGGEYGFEDGDGGGGENTGKVVSVVFGMWIWSILSCFGVLIYDI